MPGWSARRHTIGTALCSLLLVAGLTACGSGSEQPDRPAADSYGSYGIDHVANPSTEAGGTLHAVAGAVDSLDPGRSYTPWVWNLMRLYTRTLTAFVPSEGGGPDQLVGDLATDAGTPNENFTQWTFTLKPNLRFDDGTPITSADIKYGIARTFAADVIVGGPTYLVSLLDDPALPYPGPYIDQTVPPPAPPASPGAGEPTIVVAPEPLPPAELSAVATPDPQTIVFTLRRPYVDFNKLVSLPVTAPVPAARDTRADYEAAPASSGPYKIQSVDPVGGITLVRNDQWDPSTDTIRTALPDSIVVRTGRVPLERDQALLSGAADIDITGSGVTTRSEHRVLASAEIAERTANPLSGQVRMLVLPAFVAPFNDAQCRAAVAAMIDRTGVVDSLGGPARAAPIVEPWPMDIPGAAPPGSVTPTGPDQAVVDACWPPGSPPVTIAFANSPVEVGLATEVGRQLGQYGVAVKQTGVDPATYYAGTVGSRDEITAQGIGLLTIGWSADVPSESVFLGRLVDSRELNNAGLNIGGMADPAIDAAIDAADASPDPATWATVSGPVRDAAVYIPLVQDKVVLLAGERLTNVRFSATFHGYDLALVGVS